MERCRTEYRRLLYRINEKHMTDSIAISAHELTKRFGHFVAVDPVSYTHLDVYKRQAEDQARQQLILHSIQLVQAQINYSTISGKQ